MAGTSEERERQAERELGSTEIRRGLAAVLAAAFLATIGAVPALQLAGEAPDVGSLLEGIPSECTLRRFDDRLEDESVVGAWLLPRLQALLVRGLRVGNEQVYLGSESWLYHRPDVDSVAGPGFLEPRVLAARSHGGDACEGPPQPDPVAAVSGFAAQLAERGILLVLVPTPVKPTAAPEHLAAVSGPLQNPSFAAFTAAAEAAGARVFDPAPLLLGPEAYLATDTHWRPEAMERVAAALARYLEEEAVLAPAQPLRYARAPRLARHLGDLTLQLNLPAAEDLYPPEQVTIQPVRAPDGSPWRPLRGAEVLLLGDSFSNVYSDAAAFGSERVGADFSWGEGAGLAEQLSFALGRPLDRLVRNAGGAHAARGDLAREVAREAEAGRDRLAGVRVVVWQFAVRELAEGDWRAFPLAPRPTAPAEPAPGAPAPSGPAPELPATAPAAEREVVATVAARAEAPRPGSVPYRDALIALHLRDVAAVPGAAPGAAAAPPRELLAYVFGLRDDAATREARLEPGARVRLRLAPFDADPVQRRVGSLNRVELDDLDLLALPAFFGEPAPPPADTVR
jgi:SGNH hydrolase-like domain, acetyltransferase AlgX